MPYNPSTQYRGDQYIAQGLGQLGQDVKEGMMAYQGNKVMAGQALAKFEAAAQTNPDLLQFLSSEKAPPELGAIFNSLQKGGSLPVQKAAMLAQFADTYTQGKAQQQQQQLMQQKIEAGQQAAQTDTMLRQIGSGVGNGVYSPQVLNNPYIRNAASLRMATGQAPSPESVLNAQVREDAIAAKQSAAGKPDKNQPQEITLPSGAKVAFSPSTGGFSVLPQTPEALGKAEGAKAEAEVNAKTASALLTDLTDSAENARHTVGTVDRVLQLYDQGAQSGFGQSNLTQAKAALNRLGVKVDNLADQQQFEKELNNLTLERARELMKGGGSVSNYERTMVNNATANQGLTPQANKQILGVMKNIAQRSIKLDEMRSQMEDQGLSNVDISKALRKARDAMPIGVDILENLGAQPAAPASAAQAPAPLQIKSIKRRE